MEKYNGDIRKFPTLSLTEMVDIWEEYKKTRTEVIKDNKGNILYTNRLPLYKKGFARWLGYNIDYFDEWTPRKKNAYNEPKHLEFYEYIHYDCEEYLMDKTVMGNGIGSMFLLKSKYGHIEKEKQNEHEHKVNELEHKIKMDKTKLIQDEGKPKVTVNVIANKDKL